MKVAATLFALVFGVMPAKADAMSDHLKMMQQMTGQISEPGQSAFAAIAEIVDRLAADPATDWSKVNIQALQEHLADMDRVTLHSIVTVEPIAGGAIFIVKGETVTDVGSIQRLMLAHAPFLQQATGDAIAAEVNSDGGKWTVTSQQPGGEARIRGLGFYGLLATGGHHQMHHLAIATGQMMH